MAREDQFSRLVLAAEPRPFWLDRPGAPPAGEPLRGEAAADLVVIGAGFTGLWTALLAKESDPERSVVLVEGHRVGWAASGRNGGFCDASLTHGAANGRERFPGEFATLQRLGAQNLDAIQIALDRHGIDCEFERTGSIAVATEDYQVDRLRDADGTFLDTGAMRAEVNSPTYLAGVWDKQGTAMVQPARLAWGLAAACERLGVRIFERTPATALAGDADGVSVRTPDGVLRVGQVALATSAFPALVRRLRPYIVPVYDYVLVTEPLSAAQRAQIGWRNRQGIGDSGHQFHYYRLTADDRILRLRPPRPGLLRAGLHRARRRRQPVRRPGHARPAGRRADFAHQAGAGPQQAGPLPARAARLSGHPGHPVVPGPGRPPRRPPEPVAAGPGRGRPRLRLLVRGLSDLA